MTIYRVLAGSDWSIISGSTEVRLDHVPLMLAIPGSMMAARGKWLVLARKAGA